MSSVGWTGMRMRVMAMVSVVLWALGCGPLISDVTEAAVEPAATTAVEESLDELTRPENQDRINELLDLEGVESASERFGRGMVRGMVSYAALIEPDLWQWESQAAMEGFLEQMAHHIDTELRPVLVSLAQAMTAAVLEGVASPENQRRAAQLSAHVTASIMEAIAAGIRTELGPALGQMIAEEVGPALVELLDDEFNTALAETAQAVSRASTVGVMEGLREIEAAEPDEPSAIERLTEGVANLAQSLGWIFWVVVAIVVALLVAVMVWIVRLVSQTRDIKKRGDTRAEVTQHLVEALDRLDEDSTARAILAQLTEEDETA